MVEKNKYLSLAIGAAMSASLAAAPAFAANSNLFEVKPLKNGYLVAQAETKKEVKEKTDKEAKCSKKMKDGKCSKEMKDGKCGKDMKDGKCSKEMKDKHCGHKKEGKEGKCGEGTCGSKKKEKKAE